ncbi:polysaccharide deacetylase family protein [Ferruginibacter paludis]|uniref:polysaccharide deacetylase family protein n=1 Tax=Ferruginibacter paludis TaxID=1310417 RepID=UPI0025B59C9E|nr:polysaccharide deacetylase family protein [Ferruginibacter paludis]MDN3658291.1 polysaccharide deacetylase family protein [Ferruginibacter paludis]
MKVLLYTQNHSPRLQYICAFIFKELMGVKCTITTSLNDFKNYEGIKINYSNSPVCNNEFHLSPSGLLAEQTITPQTIECFTINHYKAFFKRENSDFAFDIFSTAFYLLSRYEEYLQHQKDMYGRFAHENSLAFKEDFLHLPLVNIWVKDFAVALQNKFPALVIHVPVFKFIPTYDVDIAYSFKHKGLMRNVGGFFKSPSPDRIQILLGLRKDPFDTYDWLIDLHEQYKLYPVYFFLVAAKNGLYDKNILPAKTAMHQLVKKHADKYPIGIHPSWQSGDDDYLLTKEIAQLRLMSQQEITRSRQHYIRFNLPAGYRRLLKENISDDYSMGYGSINGFRASVASSFYWFDLEKNEVTSLRIHPFCFMEANSYYEQRLNADAAFEEVMQYYVACKDVNGELITIWHNHMVGEDKLYKGWGSMYEKFLQKIM